MKFNYIYLISDRLTYTSLNKTCLDISEIKTTLNFLNKLERNKSILLVESAWQGYKNRWKYKIASYPDYPSRTNQKLVQLVERAKNKGIPTVFWNKEDSVHFDRFIDSAKHFDYILTVDENCIPRYQSILGKNVKVSVLPFAIQPKIHHPTWLPPIRKNGLFVGSYGTHIHDARRAWQDMAFQAVSPYGLTVIDRNFDRKSEVYRYPSLPKLTVKPAVPYHKTGGLIRQYPYCLNVNTITDSPSMFSRRLIEIMACGRLAVSNPSLSIQTRFEGMCEVIETKEQADELFYQLSKGYTKRQKEMMRYASNHVLQNYTYEKWLQTIINFIEL